MGESEGEPIIISVQVIIPAGVRAEVSVIEPETPLREIGKWDVWRRKLAETLETLKGNALKGKEGIDGEEEEHGD